MSMFNNGMSLRTPSPTDIEMKQKAYITSHARRLAMKVGGFLIGVHLMISPLTHASPTGPVIVGGEVVRPIETGVETTITQSTELLAINWDDFSLNLGDTVNFDHIDTNNVDYTVLNNVTGSNISNILGAINSNGTVILVNPNGVFFGASSRIDVGALVASGLAISSIEDFIAGDLVFSAVAGSNGNVVNDGTIIARDNGSVVLLGRSVSNTSTIIANQGQVTLAAGDAATLSFDSAGLIGVVIDESVQQNLLSVTDAVSNTGEITSEGGTVILSANVARDIISTAVNNGGIIDVSSATIQGGRVLLQGLGDNNNVIQSDRIDAISTGDFNGGTIEIFGLNITLSGDAILNASGKTGGGDIRVGGGSMGVGNVIADTVTVGTNVEITSSATGSGDGGDVVIWSESNTEFNGTIKSEGRLPDTTGGDIEIASAGSLTFQGEVDTDGTLSAEKGTLVLGGRDLVISEGGTLITDNVIAESTFNDSSTAINARITIRSHDDIIINDMTDGVLNTTLNDEIRFEADADNDGIGNIVMLDLGDTIETSAEDIFLSGNNIQIGSIDARRTFSQGDIAINVGINADSENTFGELEGGTITITGGTNSDSFEFTTSNSNLENITLVGGDGVDTLSRTSVEDHQWDVTGENAGSVDDRIAFSGIENLSGGAADDTFTFDGDDASLSGSISGGLHSVDGGDEVAYSNLITDQEVDVADFEGIEVITGDDNDHITLLGEDKETDWTLGAASQVDGIRFSNISKVRGGNDKDTFNVIDSVGAAFDINGGEGEEDSVDYSASGVGEISNSLTTNVELLEGVVGQTLVGSGIDTEWVIEGSNSGTFDDGTETRFSGFGRLKGGGANDTFTFVGDDASMSFSVDGGSHTAEGGDEVVYSNLTVAKDIGVSDFDGIETITGDDNDYITLVGENKDTVWTLASISEVDGINFSKISKVRGGRDTDVFNVMDSVGADFDINGGDGTEDSVDYSASGVNDISNSLTTNVELLVGATAQTLVGEGVDTEWVVNGLDSGTFNGGAEVRFSGFGSLKGGGANDTFTFDGDDASMSGIVDGGSQAVGGGDEVAYSSLTVDKDVSVADFVGIETITGDGDDRVTLVGEDKETVWTLGAVSQVDDIRFSNISKVRGGDNKDTFNVIDSDGAVFYINGGDGTEDSVDYSASGVNEISNRFTTNVELLAGVVGQTLVGQTLVGEGIDTEWVIEGFNSGTFDDGTETRFSGFGRLKGGSANDTFTFIGDDASMSFSVDGGSHTAEGGDEVVYSNLTVAKDIGVSDFDGIETITGDDNDYITLVGENKDTVWTLASISEVDGINFSKISKVRGGRDTDVFNVMDSVGADFDINGGDGTEDSVDYSASGVNDISNSLTTNVELLVGATAQTLVGEGVDTEWVVNGLDSGTFNGGAEVRFSGFGSLKGGGANDTFTFDGDDASMSGIVDGGSQAVGGGDEVAYSSLTVDKDVSVADFVGIETITGDGDDRVTLVGEDKETVWTLGAASQVDGIRFSNISKVRGGNDKDTFNVIDSFGVAFDINGGEDTEVDSVDYSVSGVTEISNNLTTNVESLVGIVTQTLVGEDVDTEWVIEGSNSGTFDDSTETRFSGFGRLKGGSANDTFTFNGDDASMSNSVDGGSHTVGGGDEVVYSNLTADKDVGVSGFDGIETITGDDNDHITLVGDDKATEWTLATTSEVDGINFSNISKVRGGSGTDTFDVMDSDGLAIAIDGGEGVEDSVDYSVSGVDEISNGLTTRVEALVGAVTQTLVGADVDTEWVVNGSDSGTFDDGAEIRFSGFGRLKGGSSQDNFTIKVSGSSVDIDGGGGSNSLTQESNAGFTETWNIDGTNEGSSEKVDQFRNIQMLIGGDGDDDFVFANSGVVTEINGGEGENTLFAADTINTWAITGEDSGSVGSIKFEGIANLYGGSENDIFTLSSEASVTGVIDGGGGTDTLEGSDNDTDWVVDGDRSGKQNQVALFVDIESLRGGTFKDVFNFAVGGQLVEVDGGEGSDTYNVNSLNNLGSLNDTGSTGSDVLNMQLTDADDNLRLGNDTITDEVIASRRLEYHGIDKFNLNTGGGNDKLTITEAVDSIAEQVSFVVTQGSIFSEDDAVITTASLTAEAMLGINLKTRVEALSVVNTGMGDIDITQSQALSSVSVINSDNGDINFTIDGALTDADADIDFQGNHVSIAATSGGIGGNGQSIQTAATSLSTSTVNENQFIEELDALAGLDLNSGNGNITLSTGGAITDSDDAVDITGNQVTINVATDGFGSEGNAIETDVSSLSIVSLSGDQFISSGLQLGNLALNAGDNDIVLDTTGQISTADGRVLIADQLTILNSSDVDVGTNINSLIVTGAKGDVEVTNQKGIVITSVSAADSFTLIAAGDILQQGDITINEGAQERVSEVADGYRVRLVSEQGEIVMSEGTRTTIVGSGNLRYEVVTGEGDIVVSKISVDTDAGSIYLQTNKGDFNAIGPENLEDADLTALHVFIGSENAVFGAFGRAFVLDVPNRNRTVFISLGEEGVAFKPLILQAGVEATYASDIIISASEAKEAVKSIQQTQIQELVTIDPAIFTKINSFDIAVNPITMPESQKDDSSDD